MKKKKRKSRITDWIQAIAAAISIPAAIFGFYSFFQSDRDLQKQITNLKIIAEQSQTQTKYMETQIDLLTKEQQLQKEQFGKNTSRRKFDLAPRLSFKFEQYNGITFFAKLINNGKTAIVKQVIQNKGGNINLDSEIKQIGEGKDIDVFFKVTNEEHSVLDITIVYEDIEGHIYKRRIYVEGRKKLFESNKVMITA